MSEPYEEVAGTRKDWEVWHTHVTAMNMGGG